MANKNDEETIYLHVSEAFDNISSNESEIDFLDVNVGSDNKAFIDPFLLKNSSLPEEVELFKRFSSFFQSAYDKAIRIKDKTDSEELRLFLDFYEPKEINLGYTRSSNKGNGPGPRFSEKLFEFFLHNSARSLVNEGFIFQDQNFNPHIFRTFIDRLGPDHLGDITANLIMDYLIEYTQRQCDIWSIPRKPLPLQQLGINFTDSEIEWIGSGTVLLPENPVRLGEALIFVPKRLLRAHDDDKDDLVSKVVGILRSDDSLSKRFSLFLTKKVADITKDEVRTILLSEKSILKKYLELLDQNLQSGYNFLKDPYGLMSVKNFRSYFNENDVLDETAPLIEIVKDLINDFSKWIVDKGGWGNMWKDPGTFRKPQLEAVFGRDFFAMSLGYLKFIKGSKILPQVGTGRGQADFLIYRGEETVMIELKKLSSNNPVGEPPLPGYIHGIERQLPIYIQSTESTYGIYITGQHWTISNKQRNSDDPKANEIRSKISEIERGIKEQHSGFKGLYYFNIDLSPKKPASQA